MGWRGKGPVPEHVKKQRERQEAARLEERRHAPAVLTAFRFTVTAVCPVTQKAFSLEGGRDPERHDAPQVQLTGYEYILGEYTHESGIEASVWHCPECGGSHRIEVQS